MNDLPDQRAQWLYELGELTLLSEDETRLVLREAASKYLLSLPPWDGVPRLAFWLEAFAPNAPQPVRALPSVSQVKMWLASALRRLCRFVGRS